MSETQKGLLRLMGQSVALDGEGVKSENGGYYAANFERT